MNSPLATLAERTTPEAATAARPDFNVGNIVTGQYLYNAFVKADDSETTKLGLVRKLVEQLPVTAFSNALNEMVSIAKAEDTAKYGESTKEARKPTPRTKTAMNHRSVLQKAFGALKFARSELDMLGYSDRTGYVEMGTLASQALKRVGKRWDGTVPLTPEVRDQKALQEVESEAMAQVRATHAQEEGESRLAYLSRIDVHIQELVDEKKAQERTERINALAVKFIEKHGEDASDIVEVILNLLSATEPVEGEAQDAPASE